MLTFGSIVLKTEQEAALPTFLRRGDPRKSSGMARDGIHQEGSETSKNVGKIRGKRHGFFSHHHFTWDRISGREALSQATNNIFARNGLAYEIEKKQSLGPTDDPTQDLLTRVQLSTGDKEADVLSERAPPIFDRDIDAANIQ